MEDKQIRLSEVKKHNKDSDVWIVINNNVYDVTAFLNEHPGGPEFLIEQAGKDGSKAFEDAGHSQDARKLMVKFKVGRVADEDLPSHGMQRYAIHIAVAAIVGMLFGYLIRRRFHST